MNLVQTLDFLFDRTDAVRFLWNLYIVVALGLLGFLAKTSQGQRRMCILGAVGFAVFAYSNLYALLQTWAERQGFVDIAQQLAVETFPTLNKALWEPSPLFLIALHLLIDITVVVFIVWLGRRKPGLEGA